MLCRAKVTNNVTTRVGLCPGNHATNIHVLEGVEERTKVEKELNNIEEKIGLDHTIDATTNEDRELNIERNLLQDAK